MEHEAVEGDVAFILLVSLCIIVHFELFATEQAYTATHCSLGPFLWQYKYTLSH